MKCKLCLLEKKPKSNTHYLSDFIIKTALNEDGVNTRSKGIYWGIDSRKIVVDFKFQQEASPKKLEDLLQRKTTQIENKNAENNIDFTVSDAFCKECEDIFSKIETEFVNNVIAKFRNSNLQNLVEKVLTEKDSRITRLFFLLQFWRTSECDSTLKLSPPLKEKLRKKILVANNTELEDIPLSITYLETVRDLDDPNLGNNYKTLNVVSIKEGSNPYAIIMNDFVIQLYDDLQFPFLDFYGINDLTNYKDYINYNQILLKVRIISNNRRKAILRTYFSVAAKSFIGNHAWFFLETFTQQFKKLPSNYQIQHYLTEMSKDKNIMKFSKGNLSSNILKYFKTFY
ncbi:hypothetical protein [Flavobacterium sp. N1736]|uniref:hypothetical protein n=1 Tax=Flavobacterium sp. N1736 TaxID=2986823 RepID=UPI0022259EF9|nr:hypothetical protein [Flavobacterium sp. N1736]